VRLSWGRAGAVLAGVLAVAISVVLASCSTSAPAPTPAPGGPGSIAGWKLTLPEPDSDGNARSVDPARISPPWLTGDDQRGLTFWAPVDGATTENSEHARTELVGVQTFSAGSGRHELTASVTVSQLPTADRDVIIGQIHGADQIKSVSFVMLHYRDGQILVVVKQKQSGDASTTVPLLSAVPLNARFDYGITDNGDGTLGFTATYNGQTGIGSAPVPEPFRGATVRFQAGAYQQADSDKGPKAAPGDGARVTFHTLDGVPPAS
jgi:hypothetical protein